ncbi:MAG: hypothetical protein M0018_11850 [Nitrospiraceae bacterium]|nr:hypothetical protein [Nitrospiraceae bacterium]
MKTGAAALAILGIMSCSQKQAVKPEAVTLMHAKSRIFPVSASSEAQAGGRKFEIRPQPVRIESWGNEKYVTLDFDNAGLSAVLSGIGRALDVNYQAAQGVSGRLTARSYERFPEKYLADVFKSVLEINGLGTVRQGASCKVVQVNKTALAPGAVTQIIPLDYVKAADIAGKIRQLMPRDTEVVIYEPANLVIAVSTPHGIARLMNIVSALDVPFAGKDREHTFVYYVENGDAKKLADAITRVYSEEDRAWFASARIKARGRARESYYRENRPQPAIIPGSPMVTAYGEVNAIIIKGTPGQYLSVLGLLKGLDVPEKQVLIDVLEAEVKLGPDTTQFGLEWLLKANAGKFGLQGGFADGNVFVDPSTPSGLNVNPPANGGFTGSALTLSPMGSINLAAFLTALQNEGRLDVLASPHVLAVDGQTADIAIGDEVPVATGLMQQPSATISNTLVSSGQIRYKTIGKLLSVVPHITEDGKVSLQLSLEVSDLGATVPIAGQTFQAFTAKKADTTAIVENGHTLLIGGLMSESRQTSRSGVPFLDNIPILGNLFSFNTKTYEKDELIVLVTPYVVSNRDEADALTTRFTNRIRIIRGMGKTGS